MIVLQIEVANFTLPEVEGQQPIAAERNAPRRGAITVKLINPPAGRPLQGLHIRRCNQRREYPPQALHEVATQLAAVIVSNEAQQAPVPDTPNDRSNHSVRQNRTDVKCCGCCADAGNSVQAAGRKIALCLTLQLRAMSPNASHSMAWQSFRRLGDGNLTPGRRGFDPARHLSRLVYPLYLGGSSRGRKLRFRRRRPVIHAITTPANDHRTKTSVMPFRSRE